MAQRLAAVGVAVALALPLLVYASVGSFARYTADDYCWAGVLRAQGFVNAQVHWYLQYSPRYAFSFIVSAVELAGPSIVPFLPGLAIVAWLGALTWTITQFDVRLGWLPRVASAFILAELTALSTFQTAPDLPQSLYWQTGMLTYLLPLILATCVVGLVRLSAARPATWSAIACGCLTFMAGGLSETYLIPQNVALSLAIVGCAILARGVIRQRVVLHLIAAWLGGVLALAAIVVAPATSYRVGGAPADLWLSGAAAVATAAVQVGRLVLDFWPVVLMCVTLPLLLTSLKTAPAHGTKPIGIEVRRVLLVTGALALTLPFCYFPSFYASNGNPPARSLIVPGAILIGYLVYVGIALEPALRDGFANAPAAFRLAAAALLTVVPLSTAVFTLPNTATAAEYAALWDAEDRFIRSSRDAGVRHLVVPPLPPNFGEKFVTPDRDNWFNQCVARFYNLESIVASAEV